MKSLDAIDIINNKKAGIEISWDIMFEKFEIVGYWWLPENPQNKLHGTLSYNPDTGATLQVMGSFETPVETNNFHEYDIINGSTGSEITLFKCHTISTQTHIFPEPNIISSEFFVSVVFRGHIFEKRSDIKFRHGRANYDYLASWISRSAMTTSKDENNNFALTTTSLKPLTASIGENLKISLSFPIGMSFKWENGAKITFEQMAFFDYETSIDIDFEEFMEKISFKIQQFLTLVIDEPIQIRELTFSVSEDGERDKIVETFLKIRKELPQKDKSLHPSQMPVSLDIISERFERILRNWFEKSSLLSPIFNLYFALQYNDKMYVEHRFLNLISCLESYHRRRFDGQYLSDENYSEFRQKIIESIPKIEDRNYEIFKTKFIDSFEYGNELNLRKRLKLIYSDNKPTIEKYIKNKDQFVDKVVNTRNYRTHFDKKLETVAISDISEYIDFNLKLKMLVELCIFKELGFELNEIDTIFSRNREYQHLLSQTSNS